MKKKIGFSIISVVTLAILVFTIILFLPKNDSKYNIVKTDYEMSDSNKAVQEVIPSGRRSAWDKCKEKYGANNVVDVVQVTNNTYDVTGYDQIEFNAYYKSVTNKEISGTCEIIACLELLMYYDSVDNDYSVNDTPKNAYVKIFDACINDGSTTYNNGTKASWADDCVDVTFETYGSDREGNTNWYYLLDNIYDSVNGRSPIILDIPGHSLVVCGIESYAATIKKSVGGKNYNTTTREEYVSVVTGWNDPTDQITRFSKGMYPILKITNHSDGYQVVWAEK